MRTFDRVPLLLSLLLVSTMAFGWGAVPSVAQTDFAIAVPDRCPGGSGVPADALPISRIRVTFQFSSSVPSSVELTRDDAHATTTVGLSPAPQSFGNGDEIIFRTTAAGDGIEIFLYPLSNRTSKANKCQRNQPCGSSGSTGSGEFAMRLRNPSAGDPSAIASAMTAYRLTSYRALSEPYACLCGTAQRRIVAEPAYWSPPPSAGSDEGRHEIDVVMVLDESGSMGQSLPMSTESRMDRLGQMAGSVVDTWAMDSSAPGGDQLGVVFFTTSTRTLSPGGSFLAARSGGAWSTLESDIRSATPQQLTAMGDGLKRAYDESGTGDTAFILFTDGVENTGDYRTEACSELASGTCASGDPGEMMNLFDSGASDLFSIPAEGCKLVQTVGVGAPGSVQVEELNDIATQTGGEALTGLDGTVMVPGSFAQALLNIIDAGTLQEIFRVSASMPAGSTTGTSRTVQVNRTARQMIATLAWFDVDDPEAMDLRVVGPNGQTRRPDRVTRRQDYLVAAFDVESARDRGAWQVTPVRGAFDDDLDYEMAALLNESVFRYRLSWHQPRYFTGDPMYLVLTLTENGRPTQELDPSGIRAELQRPGRALGTVLSETNVPAGNLRAREGDGPGTRYGRKLQYLLEKEGAEELLGRASRDERLEVRTEPVELEDGTTVGGDGTYVIVVPRTEVPGTYRVRLQLRGTLEESGTIERTDEIQTQVVVRPNLAASEVEAQTGNQTLQLRLRPRDVFGNYLGPGYSSKLGVTSPGREQPYPVRVADEETRGIYEMTVDDVPIGENPQLVFQLNGEPYHAVTPEQLVSGEIPDDPNLPAPDDGRPPDQDGEDGGLRQCGGGGGDTSSGLILVAGIAVLGLVTLRRRRT